MCLLRIRVEDLQDKQVDESGVYGIRRGGCIASVHEHMVPGEGRTMASCQSQNCNFFPDHN